MAEGIDPFLAFIIATVLTISGVIGTWIWNIRTRSDRRAVEAKQQSIETTRLAGEVERIAREKGVSERAMAKELSEQSANVASTVKADMRDYIHNLLATLRADIELQKERNQTLINVREVRIEQIRIDLARFMQEQNRINEKTVKAIEFIQTMQWGPDAKSVPAYMTGEHETQEHKDEPEVGAFAGKEESDKKEDGIS